MDKLLEEKMYIIIILQVCIFGLIISAASISSSFLAKGEHVDFIDQVDKNIIEDIGSVEADSDTVRNT